MIAVISLWQTKVNFFVIKPLPKSHINPLNVVGSYFNVITAGFGFEFLELHFNTRIWFSRYPPQTISIVYDIVRFWPSRAGNVLKKLCGSNIVSAICQKWKQWFSSQYVSVSRSVLLNLFLVQSQILNLEVDRSRNHINKNFQLVLCNCCRFLFFKLLKHFTSL